MIDYRLSRDLVQSAEISYQNMHSYYQHYQVDWQPADILQQIESLQNWGVSSNGESFLW